MVPVVTERDGRAVTTSQAIAEHFEKMHKHILRDIEELRKQLNTSREGTVFSNLNFELTSYRDAGGREQPSYFVTRDGFSLLAMGFTGEKALKFKLSYIKAFDRMEEMLSTREAQCLTADEPDATPQRALTVDDFITAAKVISSCRNERLPYVLRLLQLGGLPIEKVEVIPDFARLKPGGIPRDKEGRCLAALKVARSHGHTLQEIGNICGLHRAHLCSIINGRTGVSNGIYASTASKIVNACRTLVPTLDEEIEAMLHPVEVTDYSETEEEC